MQKITANDLVTLRRLLSKYHPDKGGDAQKFQEVYQQYLRFKKSCSVCSLCGGTGIVIRKRGIAKFVERCTACKTKI
jgi:DnaJ-class molecular chaperone